jgi:hypothetical protein
MVRSLCSGLVLIMVVGLVTFGPTARVRAQDATPTASTASGQSARTDLRYVLPFSPDGLNPGLHATMTADGICAFPSSAALDRPDAWDCTGDDGQIYDPCFENPVIAPDDPGQVACLASPFTTDVVVLNLTEQLVRQKEVPDPAVEATQEAAGVALDPWDLPWALELANGDRCTLLGGTLTVMAGQTAHYGCEEGGVVFGEVNHVRPVWTANYLAKGDFASQLVDVVAAWS